MRESPPLLGERQREVEIIFLIKCSRLQKMYLYTHEQLTDICLLYADGN